MAKKRDYNKEIKDTSGHKYSYNFDFDVMHGFMLRSFKPYFVKGNALELGSFRGDFTKKLLRSFSRVTCVEASGGAAAAAKKRLGKKAKIINSTFEDVKLTEKYDNIFLTHVLEHLDGRAEFLAKIKNEWLSDKGRLFIACPNAGAASRRIAVKMGLIKSLTSVTEDEAKHGHRVTYDLSSLSRDAKRAGLRIFCASGIFFKALANFQWDLALKEKIVSKEYLEGCYRLGVEYPELCSSIYLVCGKKKK